MSTVGPILLGALAAYALAGLVTAIAFVTVGLSAVLPSTRVTVGARLLFLPGAAALWPLVLRRWLEARRSR